VPVARPHVRLSAAAALAVPESEGCDLRRVRLVDHKPLPDADTEALWAGLRRGVLLLRRCLGCSAVHYYQQPRCRACGGEHIEHRAARG
jgi:hypothetical protein